MNKQKQGFSTRLIEMFQATLLMAASNLSEGDFDSGDTRDKIKDTIETGIAMVPCLRSVGFLPPWQRTRRWRS